MRWSTFLLPTLSIKIERRAINSLGWILSTCADDGGGVGALPDVASNFVLLLKTTDYPYRFAILFPQFAEWLSGSGIAQFSGYLEIPLICYVDRETIRKQDVMGAGIPLVLFYCNIFNINKMYWRGNSRKCNYKIWELGDAKENIITFLMGQQ